MAPSVAVASAWRRRPDGGIVVRGYAYDRHVARTTPTRRSSPIVGSMTTGEPRPRIRVGDLGAAAAVLLFGLVGTGPAGENQPGALVPDAFGKR